MKVLLLVFVVGVVSTVTASPVRANWMSQLMPVLGNATLLDLSLPGAHDTLTFDLSDTVADDANDVPEGIAWLLHEFHDLLDIGKVIRNQSITQGVNLTQMLDGGVRFIDFRITYSAAPGSGSLGEHDWYGLHFCQTNQKAITYLTHIKEWMDVHPEEIVVLWISRHGDNCNTTYPGVSAAAKLKFWSQIEVLFEDMLFDTRVSRTNETTLRTLLDRNHRMVIYLSDNEDFSNSSPFQMSGCQIENNLVPGEIDTMKMLNHANLNFTNTTNQLAANKPRDVFYLASLAGSAGYNQVQNTFLMDYQPLFHDKLAQECALDFHIPNMTTLCPKHLLDDGLLSNYYVQYLFESVVASDVAEFPNAFYIDGVDIDGTIRTGTSPFGSVLSPSPAADSRPHATQRYAYADTLILQSLQRVCKKHHTALCDSFELDIQRRRQMYPLALWDDPEYGRLSSWPAFCGGVWINGTSC